MYPYQWIQPCSIIYNVVIDLDQRFPYSCMYFPHISEICLKCKLFLPGPDLALVPQIRSMSKSVYSPRINNHWLWWPNMHLLARQLPRLMLFYYHKWSLVSSDTEVGTASYQKGMSESLGSLFCIFLFLQRSTLQFLESHSFSNWSYKFHIRHLTICELNSHFNHTNNAVNFGSHFQRYLIL